MHIIGLIIGLNSLTPQPNRVKCFHIFGSVHAMKTEIPPFDSENYIKNDKKSLKGGKSPFCACAKFVYVFVLNRIISIT
jgi:hypothetical protein